MAWVRAKVTGAFSRRVMTSSSREDAVAFTSGASLMIERPAHGGMLLAGPGTMRKPPPPLLSRHSPTLGMVQPMARKSVRSMALGSAARDRRKIANANQSPRAPSPDVVGVAQMHRARAFWMSAQPSSWTVLRGVSLWRRAFKLIWWVKIVSVIVMSGKRYRGGKAQFGDLKFQVLDNRTCWIPDRLYVRVDI
ncbi:hypothetical protein BJV78DRAFT_1286012 [Lactifluus subvellereus]|nr:hypothetical protein BJV78DRAFT_1286012 [Lactifluus subvellereus]